MQNNLRKIGPSFIGAAAVLLATSANAAIDVTQAVSGVTDAQVAILAVIGALMTLATTAFGIVKVYNFLSKKSGV